MMKDSQAKKETMLLKKLMSYDVIVVHILCLGAIKNYFRKQ